MFETPVKETSIIVKLDVVDETEPDPHDSSYCPFCNGHFPLVLAREKSPRVNRKIRELASQWRARE